MKPFSEYLHISMSTIKISSAETTQSFKDFVSGLTDGRHKVELIGMLGETMTPMKLLLNFGKRNGQVGRSTWNVGTWTFL